MSGYGVLGLPKSFSNYFMVCWSFLFLLDHSGVSKTVNVSQNHNRYPITTFHLSCSTIISLWSKIILSDQMFKISWLSMERPGGGVKYKSIYIIICWDFLDSIQLTPNPKWGIGLNNSKHNQQKKLDTNRYSNKILSWESIIIPYNFNKRDYREFLFTCENSF